MSSPELPAELTPRIDYDAMGKEVAARRELDARIVRYSANLLLHSMAPNVHKMPHFDGHESEPEQPATAA